jgi:hypothetical protein
MFSPKSKKCIDSNNGEKLKIVVVFYCKPDGDNDKKKDAVYDPVLCQQLVFSFSEFG